MLPIAAYYALTTYFAMSCAAAMLMDAADARCYAIADCRFSSLILILFSFSFSIFFHFLPAMMLAAEFQLPVSLFADA